ncbi:cytochrome d ubiquinol oxidase subunit II [Pokkaliibacter sp. CJK22405]|uniref:cytochrome d ubiquinol oxidase subunit II n=1 Tax=Pokkaliibacter sp. CJK22405 TaxID=3384615 RepID=UPI0039847109
MDWSLLYFLILGFAVQMYVLLDGFDLGIGILYPWFESNDERDHMMRSISHVWDGNETWLVFGGVVLMAAFPAAYSMVLSTLYVPIIIMLISLIFRGVAFEYRFKSNRSKHLWNIAFAAGSTVAAFAQGMILGAIVQGVDPTQPVYDRLDWLSPFSILTGFAVMAGYALLACCYLRMKSRGDIAAKAGHLGRRLVVIVMIAMALVSLWTVIVSPDIRDRWFSGTHLMLLMPLPIATCIAAWQLFRDLANPAHEQRPFYLAALLFLFGFIGLVVSLFPYLIPNVLTIKEAAAPDSSLIFMLVGVCVFLPMVCLYTLWGYRIFSGKVEDFEEGY